MALPHCPPHFFDDRGGLFKKAFRTKIHLRFALGVRLHSVLRGTMEPSAPNARTWFPTSCQAGPHRPKTRRSSNEINLLSCGLLVRRMWAAIASLGFDFDCAAEHKQCSIKVVRRFGAHATVPIAKILCTLVVERSMKIWLPVTRHTGSKGTPVTRTTHSNT